MRRLLVSLLLFFLLLSNIFFSFADTSSNGASLLKESDACNFAPNSPSYDLEVLQTLEAASKNEETQATDMCVKTDDKIVGVVRTVDIPFSGVIAIGILNESDSSANIGEKTWVVELNRQKSEDFSVAAIACEFGYAISLSETTLALLVNAQIVNANSFSELSLVNTFTETAIKNVHSLQNWAYRYHSFVAVGFIQRKLCADVGDKDNSDPPSCILL